MAKCPHGLPGDLCALCARDSRRDYATKHRRVESAMFGRCPICGDRLQDEDGRLVQEFDLAGPALTSADWELRIRAATRHHNRRHADRKHLTPATSMQHDATNDAGPTTIPFGAADVGGDRSRSADINSHRAPRTEGEQVADEARSRHQSALERYRRIAQLRGEGASLQDIAQLEGLTRERIRQILNQGEPRAAGRPPSAYLQPDLRPSAPVGLPKEGPMEAIQKPVTQLAEDGDIDNGASQDLSNAPAMKVLARFADGQMALATMNPAALEQLLFVSTYTESDPNSPAPRNHGYQREPMNIRYPMVARYFMRANNRYRITPLIVSVRLSDEDEIEAFISLFNAGKIAEIHRRWHKAIVSLMDGQHRRGGLVTAQKLDEEFNPEVPVMLYFSLDYREEAEVFDTINSTQRKLPKALIEVTKGDITEAGAASHEQTIRTITFALARDKDSVWFDSVNMTGARDPDRAVTYEGLRRSTANMFPEELLSRLKAKGFKPEQVVKDYWHMVSESCPAAWNQEMRDVEDPDTGEWSEVEVKYRLKELVGVAAVAKLGKDIVTSALDTSNGNPELFNDKAGELVSMLSEVDWEKREGNPWMASQAGFAGQKDLYRMLHGLVYTGERPGEVAEGHQE
jgi:DGQHR domain-containing protein